MKRIISLSSILCLMLLSGIVFANLNQPMETQGTKESTQPSDTLVILWTSGDPDVAIKMVFMYAGTSARVKWWSQVRLIVWGPSAKIAAENAEIKEGIAKMQENGVVIEACKACADDYGVSDMLSSQGIDVKYMGKPLTQYLKGNYTVITL
jgi:hypothetical protein